LNQHTDALIARNGLDKARYTLKLAQIAPFPDVDISVALLKEYALLPKQMVHSVTIGMPFPIWDRNKGNIMAQEGAMVRATEEPHRVELNLTNTLATNYNNYKNALDALEYYRRYILPDQVRAYRGVFERRQIDPNSAFGDLVQAQQTLATNVGTYLTILGQLWTSVVSVADLLQTDDLFQLAQPREVPALPDLEQLPAWPCCHVGAAAGPHAAIPVGEGLPAPAGDPGPRMAPGGAPSLPAEELQTLPASKRLTAPPDGETHWNLPMRLMPAPAVPRTMEADASLTTSASVSGWRSSGGTKP
jgi:cobalt-zinc-cadmium efflux system outer membrane protein